MNGIRMKNFIKVIAIIAVIGVMVITSLFVLDVVSAADTKDLLQKIVLVLSIVAFGGFVISLLSKTKA
jgi:hypothetical protein